MTAPGSFKPTCTSFCYGNVRYFCSIWKLKKVMKTSIKKYKYKQRLAQEIELVCIGQLYNNHAQILTSSIFAQGRFLSNTLVSKRTSDSFG